MVLFVLSRQQLKKVQNYNYMSILFQNTTGCLYTYLKTCKCFASEETVTGVTHGSK